MSGTKLIAVRILSILTVILGLIAAGASGTAYHTSRSFRWTNSVICNSNNDKPFSSKAMMLPMQSQITRPILFLRNCQIKRSPALAYLKTCIDKHRRPSDIFWHEAFSR